jgi:DNA-binding SARP family transcriptional activator
MQRRIDVRHDPAGFPWARTRSARPGPQPVDARRAHRLDASSTDIGSTGTDQPGSGIAAELDAPAYGWSHDLASLEGGEPAIAIRMFGQGRILVQGEDITGQLPPRAHETLYLIALHRYGISGRQLCETLFPGVDPARRPNMLHTRIKIIRHSFRNAIGSPSAQFLRRELDGYRCDPRLVTVDTWQFNDALRRAGTASTDQARAASRLRAVELYGGRLLEESGYVWAHAPRAGLQHKAVTTVLWLAEHHNRRRDTERAIAMLELATDIFGPYEEELYRHLVRLHTAVGRIDAARRTYQLLHHRLSTIGVEPSEETRQLLHTLTGQPDALHTGP